MASLPLIASLLLAVAVAGLLSGLVAWSGPIDRPRDRGAHERPVPTSGGLAIIAGAAVALLAWARLGAVVPLGLAAALCLSAAMGLLGALDDLWDFGARAKLLVQAVAALVFALVVARIQAIPLAVGVSLPLGLGLGAAGTALWLVVVANALNFMDGANGLAAGAVAIAGAAFGISAVWCGAPGVGVAALIASAAPLGFLPWNLSGRLFQGDAGALFSSTLLAALAVLGAVQPSARAVPIWTAPLALLPLLTDVLLTLLDRARRRQPLLEAHREHLYQRWLAKTGKPHAALAWRVWLVMALYGAAAIGVQGLSATGQSLAFGLAVLVSAAGWAALRRRL